ncbi:MAG: TIGR02147 family protein [Bdellovibrionaceae bacterium]|nr:TIGR02147 family protein [Pseudobdellovibrionaceae bacterium]
MVQDFRKLLKSELSARIAKNSKYSLRAMAIRIGVSASTLSDILNNKRSCSLETAEKMALYLEMSPSQKENFLNLVKIDAIKNPHLKQRLSDAMSEKISDDSRLAFEQSLFEIISDWHHNAILALLKTEGIWNEKSIAKSLGISIYEVKTALSRLEDIRLVQGQEGVYRTSIGHPMVSAKVPNLALRKYHKQMLSKALDSIEEQTTAEKVIRTETLAFNENDLDEVNALAAEFMGKLVQVSKKARKRNMVYHAGFQFFKLNKQ